MERIGGHLGRPSGPLPPRAPLVTGSSLPQTQPTPLQDTSPVRKPPFEEAAVLGLVTRGSYVCSLKWPPSGLSPRVSPVEISRPQSCLPYNVPASC